MNITLSQLRSLVAINRYGNFTQAATALHRTQPAVSLQIKQLEEELGLKLIDRTTREVRLNAIGAELAPALSGLLLELDRIVDAARKLRSKEIGQLRIGCLPSIASRYLPSKIARFRETFPGIRLQIRDQTESEIARLVQSGEVEFGITTKISTGGQFETIDIIEDPIEVIFPEGHPIEKAAYVDVEELARHDLIMMGYGSGVRNIIENAFSQHKKMVLPKYETSYYTTAISLVRAGLGVALLTSTVEHRIDPRLRSRPIDAEGFSRTITIAKRQHATLSPAASAFYDMLTTSDEPD